MKHGKRSHSLSSVVGQIGWSVLAGLAVTVVVYFLVLRGPLHHDLAVRYLTSHPVSYCATAMFFIGLVALASKLRQVMREYASLDRIELESDDSGTLDSAGIQGWLARLAELPSALRNTLFARRLRRALEYVHDRGSADGLDDELRYWSETDAALQQESFALVRILIWATPMLGFLGTVIGITAALGNLDGAELATNAKAAMDKLMAGLYVAFDTTALALTLSILLMFFQFLVDRLETELLSAVDGRVEETLAGRFVSDTVSKDPVIASVERMSGAVIRAADLLVKQQVELWKDALEEVRVRWRESAAETAETVRHGVASALDESLGEFLQRWTKQQTALLQQAHETEARWQEETAASRQELIEQSRLVREQLSAVSRILEATGEVRRLESALQDNLQSLAAVGSFEQAVVSLGATAQLLAAQIGHPAASRVESRHGESQEKAA